MFYKNARIFTAAGFRQGGFEVKDGRFGAVLPAELPADAVDLQGATVIPGLVEIHSHGNSGADFSDGDYEGLKKMARQYARCGVTSFAPASMTLPDDVLAGAFSAAARLHADPPEGHARLLGIRMEGPYLSCGKRGAQNPAYLKAPDPAGFRKLYDGCGGLIRMVDVAPELPGAMEFIRQAKTLCTVSIGHTEAGYEQARAAVEAGASHMTHLFNAMSGLHHRAPGVIPAGVEAETVQAEIIGDGLHVHPAMVRLAFRLFAGRMVLISDSGRCAGMPEGTCFEIGGQTARLQDGAGRLDDGTIACSACDLWTCLTNAIGWGIPEEEAVAAATCNPAKALGAGEKAGAIAEGLPADFILTDSTYREKRVFLGGKEV